MEVNEETNAENVNSGSHCIGRFHSKPLNAGAETVVRMGFFLTADNSPSSDISCQLIITLMILPIANLHPF